jgi:hypothetical protein
MGSDANAELVGVGVSKLVELGCNPPFTRCVLVPSDGVFGGFNLAGPSGCHTLNACLVVVGSIQIDQLMFAAGWIIPCYHRACERRQTQLLVSAPSAGARGSLCSLRIGLRVVDVCASVGDWKLYP